MKKYVLAIGVALLQTTFSMARDQAPAQNEGYVSQESYVKEFADTSDLVGARNSKQLQADMQNDVYNDNRYRDDKYDNSKRWGRKRTDDDTVINGDNCCKPKCCPKPKCCKPKCCPKPKCCKPKCCPKPKCCKPKCCKPKCPKPCCEPVRQPACTDS